MVKKIVLLVISVLSINILFGQQIPVKGKTAYHFLIDTDGYDANEKNPVILFLHGKSLSGRDLNRVKRYGVLYAKNRGSKIPEALIVAPQTANGWDPDKVDEVLNYVIEHYNVDESRIYVCGMSMGAYGTLAYAGKYPHRIAAAVAICGGGSVSDAENLSTVPLWIQHGNADRAVPMSESKKIVAAIKKVNDQADVTLTIIKGGTHGSVERLFHQQDIYDWLFKYKRDDDTFIN